MNRRDFLRLSLAGSSFLVLSKNDYALNFNVGKMPQERIIINGVLVNKKTENKIILNLWEKQTKEINELYDNVHLSFSEDSKYTYNSVFKKTEIQVLAQKAGLELIGGPMLGNISENEVSIWVRSLKPATIFIRYHSKGDSILESKHSKTSILTDLSTSIVLKNLRPGTEYIYEVYIDGNKIDFKDRKLQFHTPTTKGKNLVGRITFGSCYHRWGLGNHKMANLILSRKPDAFLLMGDVAVQDKRGNAALHRDDYFLRDLIPAWRSIVSQVPVYYTWDDHDYMDNDLAGIPEGMQLSDKENIWEVCRYAWNNPYYGLGDKGKGLFFHTTIGFADVIMVDNRYFRQQGSFLGEEQMLWLEKRLLACKSPFIILSCGTMWADYVSNGKDSWGVYDKKGRERIFQLIEKNNIKGVLLISGDRHGARGFAIPRSNGFNFYEFGGASLGARTGAPATKAEWTTQLYGIVGKFAFSEFTFSGTLKNPKVTFRLIHEDGSFIYERTFTREELTPSKYK